LSGLDESAHAALGSLSDALAAGASAALEGAGLPHAVARAGTLLSIFVGLSQAPATFAQAQAQDTHAYASLFHGLMDRGVWAPPSAFEAWFVSTAHTHEDIDAIVAAVAEVAPSLAAQVTP